MSDKQYPLHFDRNPVKDFEGLVSGYGANEFRSPLRSTVPLLSLVRDGWPVLQDILKACNLPAESTLHFEFKVNSERGIGLPSHTDLMVRSGSDRLAVEAKWTEPRYETVEKWIRKPPDPDSSSKPVAPDNRHTRLKGWIELIQPYATRPLRKEEFSNVVYQMVHRAASACAEATHPQLAYLLFTPLPDGKSVQGKQYHDDLAELHRLLGHPPGFPFHLIEVQLAPTDAFRAIQHLPKASAETASTVHSALLKGGLFDFKGFQIQTIK